MTNEPTTPEVGGEWIEWHGGENPVPGRAVDAELGVCTLVNCLSDIAGDAWRDAGRYRLVSPPAVQEEGGGRRGDGEGYLSWLMRATVFGADADRFVVTKGDLRGVLSLIPGPTPSPAIPDREEIVGAAEKLTRTLNCAPRHLIAAFGTDATDGLDELTAALAKLEGKS